MFIKLIQANLNPFLRYFHSIQHSKPSLVCYLQEPFRPVIDEFLIDWSQDLEKDDFEKNGARMFLKEEKGYELIQSVNELLDTTVEHQRIRRKIQNQNDHSGRSSKIRTVLKNGKKFT